MNYPGGKGGAGVFQTIVNLQPPHETYIEPFLGGGSVMLRKRPAALNIGIDLVASAVSEVSAEIGRNGVGAVGIVGSGVEVLQRQKQRPAPASHGGNGDVRSPRFDFRVGDALDFLRSYQFTGRELVYCDPPYVRSTCTSKCRYAFDFTDDQHRELLKLLGTLNAMVLISGYMSPLYAKGLKGWNCTSFAVQTRRRPAAEVLWFNYDKPVQLHDYRYLGSNLRERERIKRKVTRWVKRLERQPVLERQALLAALSTTA